MDKIRKYKHGGEPLSNTRRIEPTVSYLHYLNNQNEFAYGGEVNPPEGEDLGMSKEDFIRRVKTGKSSIPTQALQNQVDFLNHPFYQQNARNVWGEDANQNIANQNMMTR